MTKTDELGHAQRTALENMHKTFLEALRHREQEILRYIAILAPAVGGFIWLLKELGNGGEPFVFTTGTLGVLFLLLVGAVYSLALGYNYRCIQLQLIKLESNSPLDIGKYILKSWQQACKDFYKRYRILWIVPYCLPPEIIKVFWLAFITGIAGVTLAVKFLVLPVKSLGPIGNTVVLVGWICFFIGLVVPIWYGYKLRKACKKEPDKV